VPRVLLLLPSATYRAEDFLAAAEAVGAEVVVASERRQALRGPMGDRALRVDLRRPERAAQAVVELAERVGLDAVVAVDDGGVATAALAGERLGLAHNPPAAYFVTPTRMWELGIGGLLAVVVAVRQRRGLGTLLPATPRVVLAWLGLTAIGITVPPTFTDSTGFSVPWARSSSSTEMSWLSALEM